MNWTEYRDKIAERVADMDDEDGARFVSRSMIRAEVGVNAGFMRLCAKVMDSGDQTGADAQDMSEMRQCLRELQATHEKLARLAARQLGWDIPTEGDR